MFEWFRERASGAVIPAASVANKLHHGAVVGDFFPCDVYGRPLQDVALLPVLGAFSGFTGHPISYPDQWPRDLVVAHVHNSWPGSRHERTVRPLSRLRAMHFVEQSRPRRLLDVGCGGCHTLQSAVARYWPTEGVVGIEPIDPRAVVMPAGFELHYPYDMHEMTPEQLGTFDLVLGTHSGYRSYDLPLFFRRLTDVLRPAGGAYIDFFCDEMPAEYNSSSQTLRRCPDPQPYDLEVARVSATAAAAGLACTTLPFFGMRALEAAYGFRGDPAPEHVEELVDILVADPQDAKTRSGYFTAALWRA